MEAAEQLNRQIYFTERREDVEYAWAVYILEVMDRNEQGDPEPIKHSFDLLAQETDAFVTREAQRWAQSCRKYRLYADDFESTFRIIVQRTAVRYVGKQGYFFDYLRGSIRNIGRDLVRNARTKKNSINHLASSIEGETVIRRIEQQHHEPSAEKEALNRIIVEQMEQDDSLTEQERQLFRFLSECPEATLQQMADEISVGSRMQAKRIKDRLATKLQKYL